MSTFNKLYERTIARLRTGHTAKGVPHDPDLRPTFQQRLDEHEEVSEREEGHEQPGWSQPISTVELRRPRRATLARLLRSAGALSGLVLFAGLAILTFLIIPRLSNHAPRSASPPSLSIQPPLPTPASSAGTATGDSTLAFSIPVGTDGIRYITSTNAPTPQLGFTAAAPDGTIWFSDGASRLLHYDTSGKQIGSIPLPPDKGHPLSMQIEDNSFWLYYQESLNVTQPANTATTATAATIYHLGSDGHEVAKYAVPDYVYSRTNGRITDFLLGEHGEVLLRGDFRNLILNSSQFPNPVPTEQLPQSPLKLYWQLTDAQGKLTSAPLEVYTFGGRIYIVRPASANAIVNRGYIKVGDIELEQTTTFPLTTFELLRVSEDGSFFVGALEDEQVGNPYIVTHYTIYHYSVDGKLLARARQPMESARLLTGHSGDFYAIFEQPDWQQRENKAPDKIAVHRLTFYPADQPLPPLPTSTPTTRPLPTTTLPPPPTNLAQVSIGDLRALKAQSDIVAQVRIFGYNRLPDGHLLSMEVQRRLWQANSLETKTLNLYVPDDLWAKMPKAFQGNADPMTQERLQQSLYVLFLNKGETIPGWGDTYTLTGGPEGAFMVSSGHIRDAGIPRYNGWPADAFNQAITDAVLTTSTVAALSQGTATALLTTPEPYPTNPAHPTYPSHPTYTAYPTYPAYPTPITNLAALVQRSDVIARARLVGTNGAGGVYIISFAVTDWIKRPNTVQLEQITLRAPSRDDLGTGHVLPHQFMDTGDGEYILFLTQNGTNPGGSFPSYALTDLSNGFAIAHNGKIDYAGLTQYQGMAVPDFTTEIYRYAPAPLPIPKQRHDLSLLVQNSKLIVEAEWPKRPAGEAAIEGGKRSLQNVKVTQWLKNPLSVDYIGMALTQDEYASLSQGSGSYILFLNPVEVQDVCASYALSGYYQLQAGLEGIFEVRDGKISYDGVDGYQGELVDKLKADIQAGVPTPVPQPTTQAGTGRTFPEQVKSSQIIVQVEIVGQEGGPHPEYWKVYTFKVQKWLKKPDGYPTDTVRVNVDNNAACRFSLGKGPYILYVRLDKNASPDTLYVGPYVFADFLPVFGIISDSIEFSPFAEYWSQPVAKLEEDIRALSP